MKIHKRDDEGIWTTKTKIKNKILNHLRENNYNGKMLNEEQIRATLYKQNFTKNLNECPVSPRLLLRSTDPRQVRIPDQNPYQ